MHPYRPPSLSASWFARRVSVACVIAPVCIVFASVLAQKETPEEAAGSAKAVRIAVVSFMVAGKGDSIEGLGNSFSQELEHVLAQKDWLDVVSRSEMAEAIGELELSMSGLVDEGTATEVGKFIGANYVLVGSLNVFGSKCRAYGRLIEVETTRVVLSAKAAGVVENLFELAESLGKDVCNRLDESLSSQRQ